MKYKVGDRVKIKSLDWYNENKNEDNCIALITDYDHWCDFTDTMAEFCGKVMTISDIGCDYYNMLEDSGEYYWIDKMIEGLVEDVNVSEFKSNQDEIMKLLLQGALNIPDGYIFKDENGNVINATKIVVEKKKKEYPKTYAECAKELGYNQVMPKDHILGYMGTLLSIFQQLLICRDAYWKIAGEAMALEKPWETSSCEIVYGIRRDGGNIVKRDDYFGDIHTFEFPTQEMRDAFYENFKELINDCKELL